MNGKTNGKSESDPRGGMIFSIVSVMVIIFTILGAVAALFKNASEYQRELWEQRTDHLSRDLEFAKKAIADMDTTLQREMRLINDTTREALVSLDRRLQDEMNRNSAERRDQIAKLGATVKELADFQLTGVRVHADHEARLRSVEERKGP